jgi:hypothetical protein
MYKNCILAKGSKALELWQDWQKETKDRNKAQKLLDEHMKEVTINAKLLTTRYDK